MASKAAIPAALASKVRNRLADRLRVIAKLCRHMEKSGRCSRTDVHELRRACRAAEAAAWLLSPASNAAFEQFRACLKRLRRRAGAVRDVDVARLVLRPLERTSATSAAAARARNSLKKIRRRHSDRMLCFLDQHPRGGVDRPARELLAASKGLTDTAVLASLRSLESRVHRLAADRPRSIDAIHTLRIAGKRAVLACEILRPMPRESNPHAALVDQIGRLLDIEITIELVRDAAVTRSVNSRRLLDTLRQHVLSSASEIRLACKCLTNSCPRRRSAATPQRTTGTKHDPSPG